METFFCKTRKIILKGIFVFMLSILILTPKIEAASTKVKSISLNKTSHTLNVNATYKLTATVKPNNASNKGVTWSSSNTKVATVSQDGKVTAKAVGTATITAKTRDGTDKRAQCKITVKQFVNTISLNKTSHTLNVNATYKLTATVKPNNASNKGVTWSSSNTKVATVSQDGKVTAKAVGTATITAKTQDGTDKRAQCKITVKPYIPVNSMKFSPASSTIKVGDAIKLSPTISPSNASNKEIIWSSNNTKVATVTNNGTITAKGPGKATITATIRAERKTATYTVTVKPIPTGVTLNKKQIILYTGNSETLKAIVKPADAVNQEVTWKSSNKNVATVSNTGKVTATAAGKTTITVATKSGNFKASCDVEVRAHIQKITVINCSFMLREGKTQKLNVQLTPNGASMADVTYSSSNNNIVTMRPDGTAIAKKPGAATITVSSTKNRTISAKCNIIVTPLLSSMPITNGIKVSSPYGIRDNPFTGKEEFHLGIDLKGSTGSNIVSAESGTVTWAGWKSSYGNCVEVQHVGEDGKIFYTFYAHMRNNSLCVKSGNSVKAGQKLGVQGTTGDSTGEHLHFEIRLENKSTKGVNKDTTRNPVLYLPL